MKLLKWLAAAVCLFNPMFAQEPAVTISQSPSAQGYQTLIFPDGNNNTQYICYARSRVAETAITVSSATNASPVNFTATAHGFDYRSGATVNPTVKISGGTGSWAAANGVWVATITGDNNFTIPVDSTGFGTFAGQSLSVTTFAPRTNFAVWAIRKFAYDANQIMIWSGWASAPAGSGSSLLTAGGTAQNKACASRASYSYQ